MPQRRKAKRGRESTTVSKPGPLANRFLALPVEILIGIMWLVWDGTAHVFIWAEVCHFVNKVFTRGILPMYLAETKILRKVNQLENSPPRPLLPFIRNLVLAWNDCNEKLNTSVLANMSRLQILTLPGMVYDSVIAKTCPNIKSLTIYMAFEMNWSLKENALNPPFFPASIEHLKLTGLGSYAKHNGKVWTADIIIDLKTYTALTSFVLHRCFSEKYKFRVPNALTRLSVSELCSINDIFNPSLDANCQHLVHLKIDSIAWANHFIMEKVFPQLERLELHGSFKSNMLENMPMLKVLTLTNPIAMRGIYCSSLCDLTILSTSDSTEIFGRTLFLELLPCLKHLSLFRLTIQFNFGHAYLPSLTKLTLDGTLIYNVVASEWKKNLPALEQIDLSISLICFSNPIHNFLHCKVFSRDPKLDQATLQEELDRVKRMTGVDNFLGYGSK